MRACMVVYSFYETDNRVRRYAETLAKLGHRVDVLAIRKKGQPVREVIEGVNVHRIQRRIRNEKTRTMYLGKLFLFLLRSMWFLSYEHLRSRFDLIHVHSVPDFEVFAAWIPKLAGTKIILDIHDIVPEFYASKFRTPHDSFIFRCLIAIERWSISFSDHVIVANHLWEERLGQRSVNPSKCTTILNFPDTTIFQRHGKTPGNGKFVILYPGTINHHQGVDLAIRAFYIIKDRVPEAELHIYGDGDQKNYLKSLIERFGLQDRVLIKDIIPLHEISNVIENADLGIVPKRKDGFGNEAFSTKVFEFMILGVPVILPDTLIDKYYFDNSVAHFFQANDAASLASAIMLLAKDADLRKTLVKNADEFMKAFTWKANQDRYLDLVESLVHTEKGFEVRNGKTLA
jgi:glycosyltransferase involved in cell wall biosynthesis